MLRQAALQRLSAGASFSARRQNPLFLRSHPQTLLRSSPLALYATNTRPPPPPPPRPRPQTPQSAPPRPDGPAPAAAGPSSRAASVTPMGPQKPSSAAPRNPASASTSSLGSKAPSEGGKASSKQAEDGKSSLPYSEAQSEFDTASAAKQDTAPRSTSPSATAPWSEASSKANDAPQIPLHDLTKGIPSTLDEELGRASRQKTGESQDQPGSPAKETGSGGRGGRSMPASAYETSADRRRNRLASWALIGVAITILVSPVYLGRNWETEEEEKAHPEAPSGWGLGLFFKRVKARLGSTVKHYSEPAFPKLLPDPDPAFARPYVLVVSLEDLLVHSEWSGERGWRVAKRPGMDYFLRYLSQYYELVIFTTSPSALGGPVLAKLDPFGIVPWRLFREATRYENGECIKDLSYLNRDLSKIIMLETNPAHTSAQPENAVIIPKWNGDSDDKGLVAMIPFLEYVAAVGVDDTRTAIASFAGNDIPTEFARREASARQLFNSRRSAQEARRSKWSLGSLFGDTRGGAAGMFELGPDGQPLPSIAEGLEQGKMLQDLIRERGQRMYAIMDKEIRDNAETWLKEMSADEERMKAESIAGVKSSLTGWLPFGWGASNDPAEDQKETTNSTATPTEPKPTAS